MSKRLVTRENSRGELVTQGSWITALDREKENRFYYGRGAEDGIAQTNIIRDTFGVLQSDITAAVACANVDNGPVTRAWGRSICGDMREHLDACRALVEHQESHPAVGIHVNDANAYLDVVDGIIPLWADYVAEGKAGETRSREQAELRGYIQSAFTKVKDFAITRLLLQQGRPRDPEVDAAVNRVNDLLLTGKWKIMAACRKVAAERNLSHEAIRQAYYRHKGL